MRTTSDIPRPDGTLPDARPPSTSPTRNYWPGLDGLRGVAIALVFADHLRWGPLPGSFLGVQLFFALSGFLITSLLIREWRATGSLAIGSFFIRRFLRLFPALVVMTIGVVLIALSHPTGNAAAGFDQASLSSNTLHAIPLTLLFLADWAKNSPLHNMGGLGHMWSIAIEMQFYLLWPPVLAVMLRRRIGHWGMGLALVSGAIMSAGWRFVLWGHQPVTRLYSGFDTRADGLLLGCAAAVVFDALPARVVGRVFSSIALTGIVAWAALVALMVRYSWISPGLYLRGGFLLAGLATAVIVLTAIVAPTTPIDWVLRFPPLQWLGRISYSVYLWHYPIFFFAPWPQSALRGFHPAIIDVLLSVAVGAMSYYCIELPFNRLKKRATPPRSGPPAVNQPPLG